MEKVKKIENSIAQVSTANPDSKLAGLDGEHFVHSVLLSVHSPLLKSILQTLNDPTETVVIIPEIKVSEIIQLVRVMYGMDDYGFVSPSILDALGLDSFKHVLVMEDFEQLANEIFVLDDLANDAISDGFVLVEVTGDTHEEVTGDTHEGMTGDIDEEVTGDIDEEVTGDTNEEVTGDTHEEVTGDTHEEDNPPSEPSSLFKDPSMFNCDVCDKNFKTRKIRNYHVKAKHGNDPAFAQKVKEMSANKYLNRKCPLCEGMFNSRNLKNHIKRMHQTHRLVEECEICQKIFSNSSHLIRHIEEVHSENPSFECQVCDFTTKHRDNLKKHIIIHTGGQVYKCENCDFESKRIKELKKHKCRVKANVCELCNKKSATIEGLKKHKLRNHS